MTQETPWPDFDFCLPEDLLFEVIHRKQEPKGWYAVETQVLPHSFKVDGPCTYERDYSGLLNYVVKDLMPGLLDEGFWVLERVTVDYKRCYRWSWDIDVKYYYHSLRPATEEERHLLR